MQCSPGITLECRSRSPWVALGRRYWLLCELGVVLLVVGSDENHLEDVHWGRCKVDLMACGNFLYGFAWHHHKESRPSKAADLRALLETCYARLDIPWHLHVLCAASVVSGSAVSP